MERATWSAECPNGMWYGAVTGYMLSIWEAAGRYRWAVESVGGLVRYGGHAETLRGAKRKARKLAEQLRQLGH